MKMTQATPKKLPSWRVRQLCQFCGEDIKLHVVSDFSIGGHKSVWIHKSEPETVWCMPSLADELLP